MVARWICVLGSIAVLACDVEDDQAPMASEVREGDPCEEKEDVVPCTVEVEHGDGEVQEREGLRYCDDTHESIPPGVDEPSPEEVELEWGACVTSPQCELGETRPCDMPEAGHDRCILEGGVPMWLSCLTPLVLSFDSGPVRLEPAAAASFDIGDAGTCVTTDWPTSVTPWLALDRDRDGLVETGAELFGSGTRLPDGRRPRDGFEALATLDSNGDGRISAADARFEELVLWSDVDRDKRGTGLELEPLSARGIVSIELDHRSDPRCDGRGNCEVERAGFRFVDAFGDEGRGEVVDVHLACR